MNKTQKHLEEIILRQRDDIERLSNQLDIESGVVEMLTEQATADEKLHKRLSDQEKARHAAEKKAATEAATLKAIRDGFVPIEVLRRLVREEYKTTHNASFIKTDLTVMLDGARPVDKAILDALLVKPVKLTYTLTPQALSDFTAQAARDLAPRFANGGYTMPRVGDPFASYHCGNS